MSRTSAPAAPGALELPLTVVFRSDWGVGTGTGIAGGVDSVVEKDADARPVVRGTVLTGVVREQAATVARALDEAPRGAWHDFVTALFGTPESPRLVSFTDATVPDDAPDVAVHEVVLLSIDEDTGTAKNDFLRLFERAGACTLRGGVGLARTDLHGRSISWDDGQREAAELVLTLAGLLVRGIGSNRSDGDGLCDVLVGGGEQDRPGHRLLLLHRVQLVETARRKPDKDHGAQSDSRHVRVEELRRRGHARHDGDGLTADAERPVELVPDTVPGHGARCRRAQLDPGHGRLRRVSDEDDGIVAAGEGVVADLHTVDDRGVRRSGVDPLSEVLHEPGARV